MPERVLFIALVLCGHLLYYTQGEGQRPSYRTWFVGQKMSILLPGRLI
jgi:hypothetical protein